jgi:hypothetical protein
LSEIQNEPASEQQEERPDIRKPRGPLARLGCAIALVVWAVLILSPCILIALAVQGEINIPTGEAPDQRLRIWLIMEATQRGIGVSSASISESESGQTCVQTETNFLLWQGQSESISYCECYLHEDGSKDWTPTGTMPGKCEADSP